MSRFVRPEVVTLPISNGDTLTVKKRLTAGEQRESYARVYQNGRVNALQTGLALMTAFLVDWSLVDDTGAKVEIRGLSATDLESVLNGLDIDSFTEIKEAIEGHERAMAEARAEEKKRPGGVNGAAGISPSPSAAAGVSTGSATSIPTTTAFS